MNNEKSVNQGHCHTGKSSEHYLNKEIVLKELNIFPKQTILDAGCGNGYMSKEFSIILNNTGRIYALDSDKKAIEALKKETKNTNITPILGDITNLTKIEGLSVDLIYLSAVFHGLSKSQIDSFQKEVMRLLKHNGILAIVEIKKEPTPFGPPLDIRFSPQELKEVITLSPKKLVDAGQFFYMQLFEKKE
jgi:ubiquinone/menaquinone biosynthesis C-methylase UbiE